MMAESGDLRSDHSKYLSKLSWMVRLIGSVGSRSMAKSMALRASSRLPLLMRQSARFPQASESTGSISVASRANERASLCLFSPDG